MPRFAEVALLGAAFSSAGFSVRAGAAQQVSASVDVGAARVEYDGYLPSGALSLSPALRVVDGNVSFAARGTWLGFESGNTSVQGLLAGSWFTPPSGHFRGEFSATAGMSSYEEFAQVTHLLGRGRLHFISGNRGAWISATAGRALLGSDGRPVRAFGLGGWMGRRGFGVGLSLSTTLVGDTSYADVEGSGFWQLRRLELEGSLGARGGRGGGQGVYGEASATLGVTHWLGLTVAAGRYPTDPTRGSVSGRYASLGVRLSGPLGRASPRIDPAFARAPDLPAVEGTDGHLATAEIVLEPFAGSTRLVLLAPHATVVEIMGDFTDWRPVALLPVAGKWRLDRHIPSGVRRLNVRLDGGPWSVPVGATVVQDDFDQPVGTIVVP